MQQVQIVGAGLAGLSAAITLAGEGVCCNLISVQRSERAQSVLAEGGINAALDNMGEQDSWQQHRDDTIKAGCYLADDAAVSGLAEHAPEMVQWLAGLGVPFHQVGGKIQQRPFGGQKKRRTTYAQSSTGKAVMSALIDEARRLEAAGLITRYPHHRFEALLLQGGSCVGVRVQDVYSGAITMRMGPVILAFGGMNGVFPGATTGTTANSGQALARVFAQGVTLSNLEMIQYHPTTVAIAGKRCLVSEAARGEGGRLYIERQGKPWYFMEEKFPEFGNLMPRDVVSREITFVLQDPSCGDQVYLDMRHLSQEKWQKQLPDLRAEIQHFLGLDPKKDPIPIQPGIHYFMGGIHVDAGHRTNLSGLYAAGECCSQYHGANRLGGNSMLGAVYGGRVAATSLMASEVLHGEDVPAPQPLEEDALQGEQASPALVQRISEILLSSLGILREDRSMQAAEQQLQELLQQQNNGPEEARLHLALAMVASARLRTESRGAHYRTDYPNTDPSMNRMILASYRGRVHLAFESEKEQRNTV